ncbi:MAG TPA: hypothetical protein VM325_14040 [Alphaproteobacteria bacterium]|nr:hypothetical protein [Alphaproteobacteria bacterium]
MALKQIRLELARTKDFPDGSAKHGYEFVAPLDGEGHLDMAEWKEYGQACIVHRFWDREDDETGQLIHNRHGWAFSYEPGEEDDEPIFRFDKHNFVEGEYISVTEHDGVTRPFKVAWIRTPPALQKEY